MVAKIEMFVPNDERYSLFYLSICEKKYYSISRQTSNQPALHRTLNCGRNRNIGANDEHYSLFYQSIFEKKLYSIRRQTSN